MQYYNGQVECKYPAYDLETILDALQKTITTRDKTFNFWMRFSRSEFETYSCIDNSLADTAARLLIMLWQMGLVKF